MNPNRVDVAIVGGGIIGLATALALSRTRGLRIAVLEAEPRVARHQSGHNSGVIHSGLYYRPGSLKATNCIAGREALYAFCAEHGIPHRRCGKIVVATAESELPALAELERRGRANGLSEVRRLAPADIRALEPEAAGIAGLHVPQTGIVDYVAVTRRFADIVTERGGFVLTGRRLLACRRDSGTLTLLTTGAALETRLLLGCAGLYADRVARLCGLSPAVRIVPFRGEYYDLQPGARALVRGLIYPVPDARFPFLGVHFTRRIDGSVEAGPNAVLALSRVGYRHSTVAPRDLLDYVSYPGFWRLAARHWRTALGEWHRSLSRAAFVSALQRLLPRLGSRDLRPGGAGVRAQALDSQGRLVDDFRILEEERMIHVLNAPSPAATASLAIGEHLRTRVLAQLAAASGA